MNRYILARRLIAFSILISLAVSVAASALGLKDIAEELHTIKVASNSPIAENIQFSTYKNIAYFGELNATDPDGEKISFQLVNKPARGSVTFASDGSMEFVYTPYENKTGKDSFTYIAIDESGNMSEEATVKIKIQKPDTKVTYTDLTGHPVYNAAIRLAEENIYVGAFMDGAYYFQPDLPVTRSEFLVLSMSAVGLDALEGITSTGFFDDDSIEVWAKPYVSSALKSGIVQGSVSANGEINFGSNESISAADASFILNNLLSISDVPIETSAVNTDNIPVWACQAAVNLESVGILKTDASGKLLLDHNLTRKDAAELLSAALEIIDTRKESSGWFNW